MRIGLSVWRGRIAPVCDVSICILIVEIADKQVVHCHEEMIRQCDPIHKARLIKALNIDTLICGAISRFLEGYLNNRGVSVLARTCGQIEAVINAYLNGKIKDQDYVMPGCCRGKRSRYKKRVEGRVN